jgi:hypothetical protein
VASGGSRMAVDALPERGCEDVENYHLTEKVKAAG